MDRVSEWLGARPHRGTVVNVVMLSAILAMVNSAALYAVVGGGVVLLAGAYFVRHAAGRTIATRRTINLYQVALVWIPGALAIGLALVALGLVTASPAADLAHGLGALLFTAETAMLTVAGTDLSSERALRAGLGGAV